ncbi:MAG: GntR family transcriptional regulator [Thermococcus sp.]|nr:GntR family transcriptional regulator [Thermococcus sp.]
MVTKQTLTEQVYHYLKERITSLALPPGTKIDISGVAKQLGVSPTPVREAIHKLIQHGFVVAKPYAGFFVVKLSPRDVEELFDLRKAFELLGMRYVMQNLDKQRVEQLIHKVNQLMKKADDEELIKGVREFDEEFHLKFLIESSGSKWLARIANGVIDLIKMTTRMTRNPLVACKEHKDILEAMKAGNLELASSLLEEHLERAKQEAIRSLTSM